MKNLRTFEKFRDYREFVINEKFEDPAKEHPFYKNLIDFVLVERSPIFYDLTSATEHFSFSGAYHFESTRNYSDQNNPEARRTIFFLHDFTHLLFYYPHNTKSVSQEDFINHFIYQERLASTETEILSYYRVEGLRERVFPDEKLYYDVMRERGLAKPEASQFLKHRNRLVNDAEYGEKDLPEKEHEGILKFFQIWKTLTPTWCAERWQSMQSKDIPQYAWEYLSADNYEQVISNYSLPDEKTCQEKYEENVIKNVNMGLALLDEKTRVDNFEEALNKLNYFEGQVFFKEDKREKKNYL